MAKNTLKVLFQDTDTLTGVAAAAIGGSKFVAPAADGMVGRNPKVQVAAAKGVALGVAGYDAAAGEVVPVVRKGIVKAIPASTAIAVGDRVAVAADGAIAKAADADVVVGVALEASGSGKTDPVAVLLTL